MPTKKSSVKAAICLKMQIPSLNYSFSFFSNSTVLSVLMKITTSCIIYISSVNLNIAFI